MLYEIIQNIRFMYIALCVSNIIKFFTKIVTI